MIKIVILCVFDPMAMMPREVHTLGPDFQNEADAELRGLLWLRYRPNDLVMMVNVETSTCKYCKKAIEEKIGWVLHRWVHSNGRHYTCLNDATKQATPIDEETHDSTMA